MLHNNPLIIAPQTVEQIQKLQAIPELKEFYLVGGTALALQLGHRNSIDIDLFTLNEFNEEDLFNSLNMHFVVTEIFRRKHTIISLLNNIKTDFIRHNFPLLEPPLTEDGITFLGLKDIAAMKLHAINQSGKRLKDFVDIYYLLQHFNMQELINFFIKKYSYSNPMIAMKAVNFFDDIDENIDPPKLLMPMPVEKIKMRIREATIKPGKIFK